MTGKFFLLLLAVAYLQKMFQSFKSAGKCKKHFFFCFQNTRNLPSNLSHRLGRSLSPTKLFVASHCVSLPCCIGLYNVTSRSDMTCDFGRAVTGTNQKANCAHFESKKNAFYIFPLLLKPRNVFYRYPIARNREKKFLSYAL